MRTAKFTRKIVSVAAHIIVPTCKLVPHVLKMLTVNQDVDVQVVPWNRMENVYLRRNVIVWMRKATFMLQETSLSRNAETGKISC